MNRGGPGTVPWGTLYLISLLLLAYFPTSTLRFVRKDWEGILITSLFSTFSKVS